ncbi:ShlB/FhaC/HecB family hemolysin secretion/activation protein [Moraxella canis]|uniref:ShlB/FhaC/HecB family hemolysin secretion/activation protein n=1 Tax=Moraxella canis TaxID=90239 RepID=A0ABZ0WXT6_9GAMM|nr:ShlB/FhaC/HecB family hemolysin secretion/activation protein [Moraxella canis]WQE03845.1 ShlB/FhaC/HecB family hemolysin secretion/activation protein [Moraxella canis]
MIRSTILATTITAILVHNTVSANTTNQTLIQTQDARNQALLEQLVPNPSVVADTAATDTTTQIQEQPVADNAICLDIHKIGYSVLSQDDLIFTDTLGFALMPEIMGNSSVLGKCMTVTDIHAIATRVQNRLIEQGYVTSRIMVGDQNLTDGELRLTLIPGKIAQVVVNTADSKVPVYVKQTNRAYPAILDTALTTQTGKLLNIRDLETTLENFKRVPSADANFKIAPSDELQAIGNDNHTGSGIGFSDILIDYTQHRRLRGSLSIDDSGSKSTGKYQGVATLSADNLANYNDLFYLSFGRDLGNQINDDKDYPSDKSKGSKNYGIGYVIPIKSSVLQLNANRYSYHQTVAGSTQDYIYGGTSRGYNAKLSHLIHRDAHSKSHVYAGAYAKSQQSDIDGTLIDVQTRKTAGYLFGITHETTFGKQAKHSLSTDISYKRGTAAFNALPAPEELFDEGSARVGIYQLNSNLTSRYGPIIGNKPLPIIHSTTLKAQYATDSLTPDLKMAIGGRYTVRGFDGERSLSADNGLLIRQDISFYPSFLNQQKANSQNNSQNSQSSHAIYLGLDAGYITNHDKSQNERLLGQHLAGAFIGIKGHYTPNTNNPYLSFNYDIFTSKAISEPNGFSNKDWVSGVSLGMSF